MAITPEIARELLEADAANIIELVKAGQPLSARHRATMEQIAKQAAKPAAPAPSAPSIEAPLPPAAGPRPELTTAQLNAWAATYQTSARQCRRWFHEGAPLSDPAAMPAWWETERAAGRKRWTVPDKILAAARAANPAGQFTRPTAAAPGPTPRAAADPITDPAVGIDLAEYDPEEGDRLRELKTIQAARYAEMARALKDGSDASVLETRYLKLTETLDKMESRVTERLKKRGLFILRPDIERDLAKAAELQRQMTESEVRRVIELCPNLSAEARADVTAAILRVGEARRRVLRNLASLKSADDALLELSAA
jgi:hypothetical protein